jgi:hypothetical protein
MDDSGTNVKMDDPDELLDFPAAVRFSGLSEGAIRTAVQRKKLVVNREAKTLRIKRSDLKRYLANKYVR